jgi:16S rRNA (guanine527-N7)-methyltransferase
MSGGVSKRPGAAIPSDRAVRASSAEGGEGLETAGGRPCEGSDGAHPQRSVLVRGLASLGLDLPAGATDQLLRYLDLIARWNKVYNLTAVRDPADMVSQHLLDCLAVVAPLRRELASVEGLPGRPRVLDVGSGAGLPGVVLAIANPTWSITCVDTVAKKAGFIRQAGVELGLKNLHATHQRVEAMTDGDFDLVTSRAFASLTDFLTLTRARANRGGLWAALKARLSAEEREALPTDMNLFHVEPLQVPMLDAERCIAWMRRSDP